MMDMKEARKELKKLAKGKYYNMLYEFSEYHTGKTEQKCSVYIHDHNYYSGLTWEDALKEMDRAINPPDIEMENIEIYGIEGV